MRPPLILTLSYRGTDGLSCLSRQLSSALTAFSDPAEVEVWSLVDSNGAAEGEGIHFSGAGGHRLAIVAWSLREGLSRQQRRLVVSLHTHMAPLALPLMMRGATLVHILVGIEAWKPLSKVQTGTLKKAERLMSISQHTEREFKRANPEFQEKSVRVCHPGLPDRDVARSEIDEGPLALIVGRMSRAERYKGHDLLIEIWDEIRRAAPGAKLIVAGDGDDRSRLERKAFELGLDEAIRFVGPQSKTALDDLYRRCAFLVMPSRHEGFGFVFLEAMRAGMPCIGARGAAGEIIDDGLTGFVVDPDERTSLIEAITKLCRERALRRQMGMRSREKFLARFTAEHFQERLVSALRS
ncbi:MAG: glycosyltransferase family 4 protein [Vicinamibacteria bacterium]